jgi:hypothetical protein
VRLFNCTICDKGYPRQLDYENHLRSYDHNHRQRLADMKKLTASNDPDSNKPKAGLDMRSINIDDANKKPGVGSRFTKIGGPAAAGSRFKKVGTAVGAAKVGDEKDDKSKVEPVVVKDAPPAVVAEVAAVPAEASKDDDVVMEDAEEEEQITWEEYDFTKPTGCQHAKCPGCRTDGIWSGGWVNVGPA